MKQTALALAIGALALSACTEKPPYIQLTPAPPKADSSYVLTSLPATQPHNVLVENFTGATCSNCPAAHQIIDDQVAAHPGRINAISLFVKDFPQTTPPEHAKYDFRSVIATDIEAAVYQSLLAMPVGGIDRLPIGEAADNRPYQVYRDKWATAINTQLSVVDSINLDLTSSYDTATRKATINVKVTYLQPTTTSQKLSIAVLEDGFVDIQEFPTSFDTAYHFNDVLRGMVTSGSLGDAILPALAAKEKGRVYDVTYTYTVSSAWNPNNCRIVAFVHRDDPCQRD